MLILDTYYSTKHHKLTPILATHYSAKYHKLTPISFPEPLPWTLYCHQPHLQQAIETRPNWALRRALSNLNMSTSCKDKPMYPLALGFISSDGLLEAQDGIQVTLQTVSCSTFLQPLAIPNPAVIVCQHHGLSFLSSRRTSFPLQTEPSGFDRRRSLSALWRCSGRLPSLFQSTRKCTGPKVGGSNAVL